MMQKQEIFIKQLEVNDAGNLLKLETDNKDFFKYYTPLRNKAFYTFQGQIEKIKERIESSYSFGIFKSENEQLIGTVSLSEVARGDYQSCWIGYYLDKRQNGKGFMTAAVKLAVDFGFNELKLHRIEAGVMPHNTGSIRVLEKAGFHQEGIAKENVRINGKWEDHRILAIINKKD